MLEVDVEPPCKFDIVGDRVNGGTDSQGLDNVGILVPIFLVSNQLRV